MCRSLQSLGPRKARGLFQALFLAVCLLGIAAASGVERTPLTYSRQGKAGFTRLSPEHTGITFTNLPEYSILNGSGVAAGDFDSDGLCDLYFCRLEGDNVLYRNLGNWKFADVTDMAGVACPDIASTGAVFADLDGDSDLDLLVSSFEHGNRLFVNNGKGRFKDETAARGLSMQGSATSMALADTDGDGDLDLYVAYIRAQRLTQENAQFRFGLVNGERAVVAVNGRPVTDADLTNRFGIDLSGRVIEYGAPDIFYRNDGAGVFEPVSWTQGTFLDESGEPLRKAPYDWGLAVQFYDINDDRAPDIYVCNDYFTPDRIWMNQQNGTFREVPAMALRSTSYSSMSVDFGDFNRDGHPDGFIAEMISRSYLRRQVQVIEVLPYYFVPGQRQPRLQLQHNTLLLNRGDDTFAEISRFSGVEASEWSWSTILMDVDMDGWEDILISNGHGRDLQNADAAERVYREIRAKEASPELRAKLMTQGFEPLKVPKVAFRNNRDLTFTEAGRQWGFTSLEVSHGMALADLDSDGDMDLVMNNLGSPAGIYRNETPASRISIRLTGETKNAAGVGSKIIVKTSLGVQRQQIICGGRYLSGDQMQRSFAAGSGKLDIEIHWPTGLTSVVRDAEPDYLYEIGQPDAAPVAKIEDTVPGPLFQDSSRHLNHIHYDEHLDDWERQPSLPTSLGHLGPGITWHDYDNDWWPDLIIPSGRGGAMAVYHNETGRFVPLERDSLGKIAPRDQTTVLGLNSILLVGTSNYDDATTNGGWARVVDLATTAAGEILPGPKGCTGPLALADINGDGALDLFVGTRAVSKRYPNAIPSSLFVKKGNRFESAQTLDAGLVSGAIFSDIDLDGDPDLVLACAWGPIRIYLNEKGHFTEATSRFGLENSKGLWNGVSAADLNNDGHPDIIASNWGKNSRWQATPEAPLKLYHGDFDKDGTVDMVDARFDPALGREVPYASLRFLARALPELNARMPTFASFAAAPLKEILNVEHLPTPFEVTSLATTVFLKTNGRFVARELPPEAQFTPAFGIAAADFNGDGNQDVFLAQNFFGTNIEMPRPDPGRGLLLVGDGTGSLRAVSSRNSGLFLYGEQRGCATADFDRDGRMDLVVAQNSAATRLFRNDRSDRCLAVTLISAASGHSAIGATLRYSTKSGTHFREIQAGTGYWSVSSPTQLLGPRNEIRELEVRFPGRSWQTIKVPPAAWEIAIDSAGMVQTLK